jgi:MoaA/NifB/PqqE/SkfB family radical SAM enzyme
MTNIRVARAGNNRVIQRAAWVASRTYKHKSGESLSAISNARTHQFTTMEAEAALLWQRIEEGISLDKLQQQAGLMGLAGELDTFVSNLDEAQLIIPRLDPGVKAHEQAKAPPDPNQNGAKASAYQQVTSRVRRWIINHGYLYSFFWELTYRCNEQCIHCCNPGAAHKPGDRSRRNTNELTKEEMIELLDDLVEVGVFKLTLSGGEVFVHKDFFFLLEQARTRGMLVRIYTNGLLLNEERLQKLAAFWPESVSISLYSANPQEHDNVTRIPGSYERSVQALKALQQLGIKTAIKTPLMKQTIHGWKDIEKVGQEVGAQTIIAPVITAATDGNRDPLELNVESMGQLISLAATPGSPIFVGGPENQYGRKARDQQRGTCGAGKSMMSITPSGDVLPCCVFPLKVGSVRDRRFTDIWNNRDEKTDPKSTSGEKEASLNSLQAWRSIKLKDFHECGTHDRCAWCSTCAGQNFTETENALAPSEIQCRLATARMEAARKLESGMTPAEIYQENGHDENFGSLTQVSESQK